MTVSAFLFYWMNDQHNVPWGVAAAVAILVLGPVLGLVLEVFGRYLSDAALAVKVAGTLGIVLVVEAGVTILFLANGGSTVVNQYLPTSSFSLAGTSVSFSDVVLIVVPLLATVSLFVYFKLTRNGLAMRAVLTSPICSTWPAPRPSPSAGVRGSSVPRLHARAVSCSLHRSHKSTGCPSHFSSSLPSAPQQSVRSPASL